jgi:hypothetical protein
MCPSCPWQVILDVMHQYVKAEEHRCHDPLVHHWLVSLGFQALLTDMSGAVPGTAMASSTTLPPPERVDFRETRQAWESYFKGEVNLKDMMVKYGQKLVLVAPDRMEQMPRIISKLQRDLLELHMEDNQAIVTLGHTHTHSSMLGG